MQLGAKQFLNPGFEFTEYHTAAVAIVPVPYEGGVSYGTGTAQAPDAVIEASKHLELYDEMLDAEPYRMGIATVVPPEIFTDAERTHASVYAIIKTMIGEDKFVVMLGGDHSLSSGYVRALHEKYHQMSVIQLDAHSDLRDSFEDSPYSHACVMSRIRELDRQYPANRHPQHVCGRSPENRKGKTGGMHHVGVSQRGVRCQCCP